jgi:hypothetical protein
VNWNEAPVARGWREIKTVRRKDMAEKREKGAI